MSEDEFMAKSGEVFVVRECDDCGGAVIERWLRPGTTEMDLFDIPPEVVPWLIRQLQDFMEPRP